VKTPEERGKRKKRGGSETLHLRGGEETVSPVLKVPRQCPLLLLVEVMHMIGINSMTLEELHYIEI
jgi:hypothetical protein